MSDLIYNITKEAASQILGLSTRTIDRYISSGKLTSKKVGPKIMLAQQEITIIKTDLEAAAQPGQIDVLSPHTLERYSHLTSAPQVTHTTDVASLIDEKFDRFFGMVEEKDRQLEDKNKIIYVLNNRVGELESKIQSMIALPDYTAEKQELLAERQLLQSQLQLITKEHRSAELKNSIYVGLFMIIGAMLLRLMTR